MTFSYSTFKKLIFLAVCAALSFLLPHDRGLAKEQVFASKEIKAGKKNIRVVAPGGYCFMDQAQPADVHHTNTMRGLFASKNLHLLDVIVDCSELEDWRTGKLPDLNNFGQYITPVASLANDFPGTRRQYVSGLCRAMGTLGEKTADQILSDATKRVEKHIEDVKISGTKMLGVLREDSNACYVGILATVKTQQGTTKKLVGVFFMTLLNGMPVQLNLYKLYRDKNSLESLLEIQKTVVNQLVKAK